VALGANYFCKQNVVEVLLQASPFFSFFIYNAACLTIPKGEPPMKAAKSPKSAKNRRRKNRWPLTVLVKCSIPKFGDEIVELEMWAKDVNEDGLKLELTKGLSTSFSHKTMQEGDPHSFRFDDIEFSKGMKVKIQDLFYDDDGSPFIEGAVSWAKHSPATGNWSLGIHFSDKKAQSKELLGAFKDFLSVVKNPTEAIAKATRKK
jgi:hypothetical protein